MIAHILMSVFALRDQRNFLNQMANLKNTAVQAKPEFSVPLKKSNKGSCIRVKNRGKTDEFGVPLDL